MLDNLRSVDDISKLFWPELTSDQTIYVLYIKNGKPDGEMKGTISTRTKQTEVTKNTYNPKLTLSDPI